MAFADSRPRTVRQGLIPIKLPLSGTVYKGDLIGYSSGWKQADADGSILAEYIAGEDGVTGDEITGYELAEVAVGLSGMTKGNPIYLSVTAGSYATIAYTTFTQVVGRASNTTVAAIGPLFAKAQGRYILTLVCESTGINTNRVAVPHAGTIRAVCFYNGAAAAWTAGGTLKQTASTIATAATTLAVNTVTRRTGAALSTAQVAAGATLTFTCGTSGGARMPATCVVEVAYNTHDLA